MRGPQRKEARPASRDRESQQWLAWFVERLKADGYAQVTIDAHARSVRRFLAWTARRDVAVASLAPPVLGSYEAALRARRGPRREWYDVAGAKLFLKRLAAAGVIAPPALPLGPSEHRGILAEYERHLARSLVPAPPIGARAWWRRGAS